MQEEIIVNIAVLGYGTVGSGVVEVLTTNRETITKRAGERFSGRSDSGEDCT